MEGVLIAIVLLAAAGIGLGIGLLLRKLIFRGINKAAAEYEAKHGTTFEAEMQRYIDTLNQGFKIKKIRPMTRFKYRNDELLCFVMRFKIEGKGTNFLGIVSDSGTRTEFKAYELSIFLSDAMELLQKLYRLPKHEIDTEYLKYLPRLQNENKFDIPEDEKIVFNTKVKTFELDKGKPLGSKAKFTMTERRIFVYNGFGTWRINLAEDIAALEQGPNSIKIVLAELCLFGSVEVPRLASEFTFTFFDEDFARFAEIINNTVK